jgi:glycosyltransferase involved in cell wall biosynthesis
MLSTVIPNAVDTAEFRPDASAASRLAALCRIPAGREIVGTVGRCHPMKDHVAMIRAVARLIADGRDVHAVLLGAGQPEGPAAAEARALGIADRVSCLDNRSDVASLVAGFDVFLLPSAWGEAFPLAVAEAMAAGVPCIVTDVGDCGMLVGTEGTVVPPGDVGAMTRALHDWLDLDPAARETAGRAARARVATHFSFDRYVDAHERLYADAMAQRLGTGSRRLRSQAG